MPYPTQGAQQPAQAKPRGMTDLTPPATPSTHTPLKAAYSPPNAMQDNPLALAPDLAHTSPSMQDDSSQADSWPQQQQLDAAISQDGTSMSHHDGGAMSHDDGRGPLGTRDAQLRSSGNPQAPQQQQQQSQLPAAGTHADQWGPQSSELEQSGQGQQEGELSRSSLDAQLRSSEMTSMQSDEILMHATGDVPIPGGMTANPMYNVQGARWAPLSALMTSHQKSQKLLCK